MPTMNLSAQTTLLFVGDSITDCGRREDPQQLGSGYVRLLHDWLCARDPANAPRVINTGIGGNTVLNLKKRWERDVLEHHPDIVSIKIGINDAWEGLTAGRSPRVAIDAFVSAYREILLELRGRLPACRIVLVEPFVVAAPNHHADAELLQPYVRAVNDLAGDFVVDAVVHLFDAFREAQRLRPDIDWASDGVHPTSTGHALIARHWLLATGTM